MVTECIWANFTLRSWCSIYCTKERLFLKNLLPNFFNEWRWCLTVLPRQSLQSQCCCPEDQVSCRIWWLIVEVMMLWCLLVQARTRGSCQREKHCKGPVCHLEMARRVILASLEQYKQTSLYTSCFFNHFQEQGGFTIILTQLIQEWSHH